MIVDNSILETTASCMTKAAMQHVLGLQINKEVSYFESGTAVHKGMEAWYSNEGKDAALKAFDDYYKVWASEQDELDGRLMWGNVRQCLETWLDQWQSRTPLFDVQGVELAFKIEIERGVFYCGAIDVLGRDRQSGMLCPVDHKTTGRLDGNWERKWRYSSQMSGYYWAIQTIYKEPVWGVYINGIELKQIPGSSKKCPAHGVPYRQCGPEHLQHNIVTATRTQEQVNAWWQNMQTVLARFKWLMENVKTIGDIAKVPTDGTMNGSCYMCNMKDFCHLYGRKPETVGQLFKSEMWNPLDGKTVIEGSVI